MKKNSPLFLLLLFAYVNSYAQQQPQFTQYMYNTIAVNPAYAGSREALSIIALNRNQWAGFDGGPQTQTLSIHSPLRNEKVGLGLSLIKDKLGYEDFTSVYADFSYTIKTSEKTKLSFGLKGGATYYKIDDELYNLDNPDPYFDENNKFNRWNMNIGAGALLHSSKWYFGLSMPRIINHDNNSSEIYKSLDRVHYFLIAGYVFDLSETLKFKPSIINKYVKGAPLSTDVTANFLFNEKFWLGASYRINNDQRDLGFFADFQVSKQFRVGYAYEIPTGEIRPFTTGSHEILLIYEFKFLKNRLKSPRYF
ncbi:MAG: type IX secretion system membrane protein PorP/SprF [Flavobacteriaceae bacterium]|nr:type IX secretion system membrane protein PorP/SprF [Flavobacteriaceae bacterium]